MRVELPKIGIRSDQLEVLDLDGNELFLRLAVCPNLSNLNGLERTDPTNIGTRTKSPFSYSAAR
jgi:hypothetical protein